MALNFRLLPRSSHLVDVYGACFQVERSLDFSVHDDWNQLRTYFEEDADLALLRRIHREWIAFIENYRNGLGAFSRWILRERLARFEDAAVFLGKGIEILEMPVKPDVERIVETRLALSRLRTPLGRYAAQVLGKAAPPVRHFNYPERLNFVPLEELIGVKTGVRSDSPEASKPGDPLRCRSQTRRRPHGSGSGPGPSRR